MQSQVDQLSANQVILTDKLLDSATAHASIEKDESASDFVRKLSSPSNNGLHRRTISSPISPSKEGNGDTMSSVNKQRSWSASPKNKTRGLKSKTSDINNQSTTNNNQSIGFDNEYINNTSPDRIAKNSAKRYQPPRFNPLSIEQGDGTLEVKPNDYIDEECMHQQQNNEDAVSLLVLSLKNDASKYGFANLMDETKYEREIAVVLPEYDEIREAARDVSNL